MEAAILIDYKLPLEAQLQLILEEETLARVMLVVPIEGYDNPGDVDFCLGSKELPGIVHFAQHNVVEF